MSILRTLLGKSLKSPRAAAAPRRLTGKPAVESLECRELLTGGISYNPATHVLMLTGDQANAQQNDTITLQTNGNSLAATINGHTESYGFGGNGVQEVFIFPGGGKNTVQIVGVPKGIAVDVFGGAGNDTVKVTVPTNAPTTGAGTVNLFYNGGGQAALDVADYSHAMGENVTINNGSVQMNGWVYQQGQFLPGSTPVTAVNYSGKVTSLEVDGGNANTFQVLGTSAATPLSVYAGTGNNTVNVGGSGVEYYGESTHSLAAVAGPVNVYDSCGKTTLNVDNSGGPGNEKITVTDKSVSFAGGPTINYQSKGALAGDGVTALNVFAPEDFFDPSVYTVQSVSPATAVTLWGGGYYKVNGPAANKVSQQHYMQLQ